MASVFLRCKKATASEQQLSELLSANSKLPHFYQSVACRECNSQLLSLEFAHEIHINVRFKAGKVSLIYDTEPIKQ